MIYKKHNQSQNKRCELNADDVTEIKTQQQELLRHKQYIEALDKISSLLLSSASEVPYEKFLSIVGPLSGASGINIIFKNDLIRGEDDFIYNTIKWTLQAVEQNIVYEKESHKFLIDYILTKVFARFQKAKLYCFSIDSEDISDEEIRYLQKDNVKSSLLIPIITDEHAFGFVVFDNCQCIRKWNELELEFLNTAVSELAHTIKRKHIKEQFIAQRDFADQIVELAQTIVLVLDTGANILRFNPYFEKLSGYSLDEVKGKNWFDIFILPRDHDRIRRVFSQMFLSENIKEVNNPILTKNGQLQIEWRGCIIKGPDGKPVGVLATGQDVTERLENEKRLRQSHEELEKEVEVRTAQLRNTIEDRNRIEKILKETEKFAAAGKLAAQIAHEINNPLAGIKNSFLLIKDAIPPEHKYFNYVAMIEREISRVSQIVRQMFELYRPGTKSAEKFGVRDTVNDVAVLLKAASSEKNINLDIDCGRTGKVVLSEALFRQVIYNILQNAIEASPNDGTVNIKACTNDGHLELTVTDYGGGIDESIKEKIFDPFFTTGRGGPGSGLGLGLAITKDIVNAMQGSIEFSSSPDKETVFKVIIPVKHE